MIKELRIKFTVVATISVLIVVTVILGCINLMNYRNIVSKSDRILDMLSDYDGTFPINHEQINKYLKSGISKETPYESRYFTAKVKENGTIINTNVDKVAAIDRKGAEEYAQKIMKEHGTRGFISDYRYKKVQTDEETYLIIFLDCSHILSAFYSFLSASILISAIGIIMVFIFIITTSSRIVRPYVENYEKQKRFITDAGHEIKTPLTIIDADTSVLEMESGENEWLSDIHVQIDRLKELTNDLIYLAKMEEKDSYSNRAEFSISETARNSVESFQAIAKLENKKIEAQIEPLVNCYGNPKEIKQLFSILLDNSMKYSSKNGKIIFKLKKGKRNTIHVEISNSVDSINKDQIVHLFDRFYRTDLSRNSQTGGYGIGLSIAKAIVTSYKGKITASSVDGKFLCISITL